MAEYSYLILTNSTGTLSKRFRVIAEGYDNGLPEKTVSASKTVGGGLDVSQGAIYLSWSPIIRVLHTETDSNYGTLDELETFFRYNNPNGSPSDKITLIDHQGRSYIVIMLGDFRKSLLTARIEGTLALYYVKLRLQQVYLYERSQKSAYLGGA